MEKEIASNIIDAKNKTTVQILNERNERLKELVQYAKENSPYLSELYKNIDTNNFNLEDLPILEKATMMALFEDWVTDREVKISALKEYISDTNNLGNLYLGKYQAISTSGTTGNPLTMLKDNLQEVVTKALTGLRFFNNVDLNLISPKTAKMAGIIAIDHSTSSYNSFIRMKKTFKDYENNILLLSTDNTIRHIVNELNKFQPDTLTGYSSILSLLAKAQLEGSLDISPKLVINSAELLTDEVYETIKNVWKNAQIRNNYCTTEAGEIAMSCDYNNLHQNMDWIIIEPVDENDKPVKAGEFSSSVLVTNLANYIQPIIRFRLNDRVQICEGKCPCGSKMPIIKIQGRVTDPITVNSKTIAGAIFLIMMDELPPILAYQFAHTSETELELRVVYNQNSNKEEFVQKCTKKINNLLQKHNCSELNFKIVEKNPVNSKQGGKVKLIVREF